MYKSLQFLGERNLEGAGRAQATDTEREELENIHPGVIQYLNNNASEFNSKIIYHTDNSLAVMYRIGLVDPNPEICFKYLKKALQIANRYPVKATLMIGVLLKKGSGSNAKYRHYFPGPSTVIGEPTYLIRGPQQKELAYAKHSLTNANYFNYYKNYKALEGSPYQFVLFTCLDIRLFFLDSQNDND